VLAAAATTEALAGRVGKNELVINVKDYGALGDGATDDSTAILAAIAAIRDKGGTVYFPHTQTYYKMTQPLPNRGSITYRADGRLASRIRWTVGSMLVPTADLNSLVFEDIYIDSASSAPLIDLGSTGGLRNDLCQDARESVVLASAICARVDEASRVLAPYKSPPALPTSRRTLVLSLKRCQRCSSCPWACPPVG
jgi:hypothetical protein